MGQAHTAKDLQEVSRGEARECCFDVREKRAAVRAPEDGGEDGAELQVQDAVDNLPVLNAPALPVVDSVLCDIVERVHNRGLNGLVVRVCEVEWPSR